ncbi:hypothetical protein D3C86_937270 [compost metagenome]
MLHAAQFHTPNLLISLNNNLCLTGNFAKRSCRKADDVYYFSDKNSLSKLKIV